MRAAALPCQDPSTKKWLLDFSQSRADAGPGQSIFFAEADTPTGPWRNATTGFHPYRPGDPPRP